MRQRNQGFFFLNQTRHECEGFLDDRFRSEGAIMPQTARTAAHAQKRPPTMSAAWLLQDPIKLGALFQGGLFHKAGLKDRQRARGQAATFYLVEYLLPPAEQKCQ